MLRISDSPPLFIILYSFGSNLKSQPGISPLYIRRIKAANLTINNISSFIILEKIEKDE